MATATNTDVIVTEIIDKLSNAVEDANNGKIALSANQKEAFLKYQKTLREIFYDKNSKDNILDISINEALENRGP
jgi:hypothetical protein